MRYLRGDGVDETDARTSSGGAVAWYLPDHLGTIRDISNSTGAVVDHLDYDGFGNTSTTPTGGDRYLFTSREYDSETGLYYSRNRYYNPFLGRWLSQDPLGLGVDSNPYRYVGNSPTNYIDPTGLAGMHIHPGNFWAWRPGTPPPTQLDQMPGVSILDPRLWPGFFEETPTPGAEPPELPFEPPALPPPVEIPPPTLPPLPNQLPGLPAWLQLVPVLPSQGPAPCAPADDQGIDGLDPLLPPPDDQLPPPDQPGQASGPGGAKPPWQQWVEGDPNEGANPWWLYPGEKPPAKPDKPVPPKPILPPPKLPRQRMEVVMPEIPTQLPVFLWGFYFVVIKPRPFPPIGGNMYSLPGWGFGNMQGGGWNGYGYGFGSMHSGGWNGYGQGYGSMQSGGGQGFGNMQSGGGQGYGSMQSGGGQGYGSMQGGGGQGFGSMQGGGGQGFGSMQGGGGQGFGSMQSGPGSSGQGYANFQSGGLGYGIIHNHNKPRPGHHGGLQSSHHGGLVSSQQSQGIDYFPLYLAFAISQTGTGGTGPKGSMEAQQKPKGKLENKEKCHCACEEGGAGQGAMAARQSREMRTVDLAQYLQVAKDRIAADRIAYLAELQRLLAKEAQHNEAVRYMKAWKKAQQGGFTSTSGVLHREPGKIGSGYEWKTYIRTEPSKSFPADMQMPGVGVFYSKVRENPENALFWGSLRSRYDALTGGSRPPWSQTPHDLLDFQQLMNRSRYFGRRERALERFRDLAPPAYAELPVDVREWGPMTMESIRKMEGVRDEESTEEKLFDSLFLIALVLDAAHMEVIPIPVFLPAVGIESAAWNWNHDDKTQAGLDIALTALAFAPAIAELRGVGAAGKAGGTALRGMEAEMTVARGLGGELDLLEALCRIDTGTFARSRGLAGLAEEADSYAADAARRTMVLTSGGRTPVVIDGLPASRGIQISRRVSVQELQTLTEAHGVEFSLIYRAGPGPNGAGGTYWLYSGTPSRVFVPIAEDVRFIAHTHPEGPIFSSAADRNALRLLRMEGSPQRSSLIVPTGEFPIGTPRLPHRFTETLP